MKRLQIALLLVAIFELAACHPRASKGTLADPPQDVASGSVFTLKKRIVIPAGSAAVQFQDTQLVAPEAIRPNYPYCRFGLDDPASTAREVKPQSFTVTSVDYEERSAGSSGEAASLTRMNLQTAQGAKGYRMTCMLPGAAASARFVTVSEINGAVGDFFTLKRAY
jgi:hypothetical protein